MVEIEKGMNMEVNSNLLEAARGFVQANEIEVGAVYEIPGYRKMHVALAAEARIHAMKFFTEDDVRYVIGPVKTQDKEGDLS